jgi:NAD(P)-dependent dehydrogenase (short-subunit alcohol dehydrogenase family)
LDKYLDKFLLKNKIIYLTGAAGLIGREASRALASMKAKVILLDIDETKGKQLEMEIRKRGGSAYFEYFDISELDKIEKNVKELIEKYEGINGWVNSAYPKTEDWSNSIENLKLDSWRKNIEIHLNAYAWVSRIACLKMRELKDKGSLVNISSIYGIRGCDFTIYNGTNMTTPMAYPCIKAGIINLTRYLASYFGKDGIRVNTICPGGIFNHQNAIFVKNYESRVPLRRMGRPEDVASVIVFLCSDASDYITGETIIVDGGWTAI